MAWIERAETSGGETRYKVRWRDPETGAKEAESRRTLRAARELKAAIEYKLGRGEFISKTAGDETLETYLEEIFASSWHLRSHVLANQRAFAARYVIPTIGKLSLNRVKTGHLRTLLGGIEKPGSRSAVYTLLRRVFSTAQAERRVAQNPMDPIKLPARNAREPRFLTPQEVWKLAGAMPPRYRALVVLAAYGGLRLGECLALTQEDVNGELSTVNVRKTLVVDTSRPAGERVYVSDVKTRASRRIVDLPDFVTRELVEHAVRFGRDPHLFVTDAGKLVNRTSLSSTFRRAAASVGLEGVRFHDLRHTSVAWCIQAGAHPKEIQARHGHANISVTMDTYGHLFPNSGQKLATRLAAIR